MASDSRDTTADPPPVQWTKVGLLFVGSGCAALIYEVVWFHLLRLVIGGSSISLGIVLASFLGGMCIGSFLYPLVVSARFHPLRVYATLELAIGVIGATLPWWLPAIGNWYLAAADRTFTGMAARAVVAGVCLLPPTILMGATLPAIARWIRATPDGLARLATFYGANTLGAVLGCLAVGFVLLPQTDVIYSSYVAATINLLVALVALAIAGRIPYQPLPDADPAPMQQRRNAPAIVCVIIGLSGFAALGGEVIWTRMLSLLFGVTVYTFAIILAVFLAGIGIGSTLAARWAQRTLRPIHWLAICQLAIACWTPLANHIITRVIPFWERPVDPTAYNVYAVFLIDFVRAAVALFPPTLLWGASFSLALAATGIGRGDASRLVGQIYAANTLGAVLGALSTGMLLVPWFGCQRTQQVIALISGVAATLAVYAQHRRVRTGEMARWLDKHTAPAAARPSRGFASFAPLVPLAIALLSIWLVAAPPPGFLASALYPNRWSGEYRYRFLREGRHAPVAVQEHRESKRLYLWISGKIVASNLRIDMRTQRLLGHLPALIHGEPKTTLTVGLGSGTTAGCFVIFPSVEQIQICEIEPVVEEAARQWFAEENHDVLDDPRTELTIDDARHYLATAGQKFDVITSDPIHPWVRGAAALFSAEYYEICKQHLNPGGVIAQWIPVYDADPATVKCQLGTFVNAFPHTMFWTSWRDGDGGVRPTHDIIAIGRLEPIIIDVDALIQRINGDARLKADLDEVQVGTIGQLFGQYVGSGDDLKPWLADAAINADVSLKLEYLAGLWMWINVSDPIMQEIYGYLRYPEEFLTNDEEFAGEIRLRLRLPAADQ
jgi:spermidine synthase